MSKRLQSTRRGRRRMVTAGSGLVVGVAALMAASATVTADDGNSGSNERFSWRELCLVLPEADEPENMLLVAALGAPFVELVVDGVHFALLPEDGEVLQAAGAVGADLPYRLTDDGGIVVVNGIADECTRDLPNASTTTAAPSPSVPATDAPGTTAGGGGSSTAPGGGGSSQPSAPSAGLPKTGTEQTVTSLVAASLIAAGVALVWSMRRRSADT